MRFILVLLLLSAGGAARAANPDALWQIVHGKCVPDLAAHGDPAPCAEVAYPGGAESGYAVFKDRNGAAQFLLIPTEKRAGIEDPAILAPDAPNYWRAAWRGRGYMLARIGHDLPREDISLAINSPHGRSQRQLHIHIDCIAPSVLEALRPVAGAVGTAWAALPVPLAGHRYRARRVEDADFAMTDPFRLLAADDADMGRHTLVAVGWRFGETDGFLLLDDAYDPLTGDFASGEELQDHTCAVAR